MDAGPETRHAVDEQRAQQVRDFVSAMGRNAAEVQIERTRPTWCAGYLESYDVGPHGWRELLEYIRDEHGGHKYRLALVTPNGHELAHVNQPIAGPPRERGRVINREAYERRLNGEEPNKAAQPAQPQPTQPQQPHPDVQIMQMMIDQQREGNKATLEAVRDMVQSSKEHTNQLLGELVKPQQGSLGEQLASLHQNVRAVEKIKSDLAPEPEPAPEPDDDKPDLSQQREQMTSQFLQQAILQKIMGGGSAAPAAPGAKPPPQPKYQRPEPRPKAAPKTNGARPPKAVED